MTASTSMPSSSFADTLVLGGFLVLLVGAMIAWCIMGDWTLHHGQEAMEAAQRSQRLTRHPEGLQALAVAEKMDTCVNNAVATRNYDPFEGFMRSEFSAAELTMRLKAVERTCATALINSVALGSPKGAEAITAELLHQHYAVPDAYSVHAHADPQALAAVTW